MVRKGEVASAKKPAAISEGDKGYARTTTRLMIAGAVWKLWGQLTRETGVDQNWLAARLDKDKSRVSRLLKAPGNWTLDTVADLLEAMEGRIVVVEAKRYSEIAAGSSVQPSMTALRESGRFWNLLEVQIDYLDLSSAPLGEVDVTEDFEEDLVPIFNTGRRSALVSKESK